MKSFAFLGFIVLLTAACTVNEKSGSISLEYKSIQFRLTASSCADSASCTSFEVNYPAFTSLNADIAAAINQKIIDAIGFDNPETDHATLKEMGERFIADYEDFQNEFQDNEVGWYFLSNATVLLATDTLLSIEVSSEYYTGGAHGGFSTYFVNVDPTSGQPISLQSVFKEGFEETLRNAGEASFREARVLSDTTSFSDNGFEFKDDKFALNDNYGFRPEGIVFFYNAYEVAPYVLGPTEILIPYEVMKNWLR